MNKTCADTVINVVVQKKNVRTVDTAIIAVEKLFPVLDVDIRQVNARYAT